MEKQVKMLLVALCFIVWLIGVGCAPAPIAVSEAATPAPPFPATSEKGACGDPCWTNAQCDGANPICTEFFTCYDARLCGDSSPTPLASPTPQRSAACGQECKTDADCSGPGANWACVSGGYCWSAQACGE